MCSTAAGGRATEMADRSARAENCYLGRHTVSIRAQRVECDVVPHCLIILLSARGRLGSSSVPTHARPVGLLAGR